MDDREALPRQWRRVAEDAEEAMRRLGIKRRRTTRRGRPSWTAALFRDRLGEAEARAGSTSTTKVAEHFRGLNGGRGIDPRQLQRLKRRFPVRE